MRYFERLWGCGEAEEWGIGLEVREDVGYVR